MKLTILGTAAMVPTKDRNHAAVLLEYKGTSVLFDCGEGTQRQFSIAGLKITKVKVVCLSHFHGDHVLGVPGLVQSLAQNNVGEPITILGPQHTTSFLKNMLAGMYSDHVVPYKVIEITKDTTTKFDEFSIRSAPLKHGVPCVGFTFIEHDRRRINTAKQKKLNIPDGPHLGMLQDGKTVTFRGKKLTPDELTYLVQGKRVAYITDTEICDNCYVLAEDADVLISEATHASDLAEKAEKYKHLTAKDAGLIASKSGVKKLVLTHFSGRYKTTQEIQDDVGVVFDNVVCAHDFLKMTV